MGQDEKLTLVEERLTQLQFEADTREAYLRTFVENLCPGTHNPTLHPDNEVPWCNHCGRTARGDKVGKIPEPIRKRLREREPVEGKQAQEGSFQVSGSYVPRTDFPAKGTARIPKAGDPM